MIFDISLESGTQRIEITPGAEPDSFICRIGDRELAASARLLSPGVLSLIINGQAHRFLLDRTPGDDAVIGSGQRYPFTVEDPRSLKARRRLGAAGGGTQTLRAPMPGRVLRILVEPGQEIAAQQGVMVVEAMKMQNELKCPRAGRVKELRARVGDTVEAGQALCIIE